jgi:hypothetical protein
MWSAFSHFWAIRAEVATTGIFEVTCLMDRATSSQSITPSITSTATFMFGNM